MSRREWFLLSAFVLFWRLCHAGVLWVEEAYPLAAALEVWHGRWPYHDFWYDKPPGAILFYLPIAASAGWLLRVWGAAYVLLCCYFAARLGGLWAAWLLAAFLSWGIPAANYALAPDLLLLAPHLAAVFYAQQSQPWRAGCAAGLALLVHSKGLFVLAAALLWCLDWRVLAGFALLLPCHLAGGDRYVDQVWLWGQIYSANTFVVKPLAEFGRRTLNWLGFHAAAVLAIQLRAAHWPWRAWAWLGLSLATVCLGLRFFPRYYFFLLAPAVVLAGQAMAQLRPRARYAVLALLLIPAFRFAPGNLRLLLGDDSHPDLALFRDSRQIAATLRAQAKPGDTLFVWGYRPDVSVLARLPNGTLFLESQPLTCVFADRHLQPSAPMPLPGCVERLHQFQAVTPTWFVDGLGPLNPQFALPRYRSLAGYELVERTNSALLYRAVANPRNLPQPAHRANPDAATPLAAATRPAAR